MWKKETTRFSQTLSLHCTHTIQERLKKTLQHLSDARCISGETLSSQQTTPLHPARASPSSSPAVVFSLSLSSPTISRVFSLTLPQFFLSLLIISLRHLFSFLPHRPWLFCSHSEHVQRPVLEIGIKGARLRLGRQSKGVGQGHVALGGMWRDGGLRT